MKSDLLRAALIKSSGLLDNITDVGKGFSEPFKQLSEAEQKNYETMQHNAGMPLGLIGTLLGATGGAAIGALPETVYDMLTHDPRKPDPHHKARLLAGVIPGAILGGGALGAFGQHAHQRASDDLKSYQMLTGRWGAL